MIYALGLLWAYILGKSCYNCSICNNITDTIFGTMVLLEILSNCEGYKLMLTCIIWHDS